jgi:hypothetical protein
MSFCTWCMHAYEASEGIHGIKINKQQKKEYMTGLGRDFWGGGGWWGFGGVSVHYGAALELPLLLA